MNLFDKVKGTPKENLNYPRRLSIHKDCSNCFYNLEENFAFYPCADCIKHDSWKPVEEIHE